jgi:hypothetical protein
MREEITERLNRGEAIIYEDDDSVFFVAIPDVNNSALSRNETFSNVPKVRESGKITHE